MPSKWSPEDVLYLRKSYTRIRVRQIAQKLNKTENAVWSKAKKLGLQLPRSWTKAELDYLKANYGPLTGVQIAKQLKRPYRSVLGQAHKLGMVRTARHRRWAKEEDNFLKANRQEQTAKELAAQLSRSVESVKNRLINLGLAKPLSEIRKAQPFKLTEIESAYLAGLFDGEGTICISIYEVKGCLHVDHKLAFTNTDAAILKYVAEKLNLAFYARRRFSAGIAGTGKRSQICLVLEALLPYLRIKRQRAEKALAILRLLDASKERNWREILQQVADFSELNATKHKASARKLKRLRAQIQSYDSKTPDISSPKQ